MKNTLNRPTAKELTDSETASNAAPILEAQAFEPVIENVQAARPTVETETTNGVNFIPGTQIVVGGPSQQ